jgi:hypothetical protein
VRARGDVANHLYTAPDGLDADLKKKKKIEEHTKMSMRTLIHLKGRRVLAAATVKKKALY